MQVALKWITPDAERVIVECARVSTSMESDGNDARLLRYLYKNKHWSPFEMASACFYIETDRAVARQILRHRSFSFQEFSQRYAEPGFERKLPYRVDSEKNRQSSVTPTDLPDVNVAEQWGRIQDISISLYQSARNLGVAKEVARAVLPEGLTTSKLFITGNMRSWIHYVMLRTEINTQEEHRAIASEINRILSEHLPNCVAANLGYVED